MPKRRARASRIEHSVQRALGGGGRPVGKRGYRAKQTARYHALDRELTRRGSRTISHDVASHLGRIRRSKALIRTPRLGYMS